MKEIYEQDPFKVPKNRCNHFASWQPHFCLYRTFLTLISPLLTGPLRLWCVVMHSGFIVGHYAMNECISFLFVPCQQCFRNLNTSSFLLITQQSAYPSGWNFSKQQLVFDNGLHAPIADRHTKLLTNFNHSKLMIAFNKVTNQCNIL